MTRDKQAAIRTCSSVSAIVLTSETSICIIGRTIENNHERGDEDKSQLQQLAAGRVLREGWRWIGGGFGGGWRAR